MPKRESVRNTSRNNRKTRLTPELFASLKKPKIEPISSSAEGKNIPQTAQQLFTKRSTGMVIEKKIPERPKESPAAASFPTSKTPGAQSSNFGAKGKAVQFNAQRSFSPQTRMGPATTTQNTTKGKRKGGKGTQNQSKKSGQKGNRRNDWYSRDWGSGGWGKGWN